jgi:hypothetical protein
VQLAGGRRSVILIEHLWAIVHTVRVVVLHVR